MHSACPDRSELVQFAVGNLPRPELDRVGAHVQACPHCVGLLDELDEVADPLVAGVRVPMGSTIPSAELPAELLRAGRSGSGRLRTAWTTTDGRRQLGKFELLEELGAGSFGSVFRARDTELDRTVAIKILRAGKLASRE